MFNKRFWVLLLGSFLLTATVFANTSVETEWGIQYKMKPSNPGPGDYVFLDIYSYSMDLASSNITYTVNGEVKNAGTGLKNFTFQIPNNNNVVSVGVSAKDFNGKEAQEKITIKPVSVDLVYEVVDPYRPLFYKGKSTALSHSEVTFFAFPNFKNALGKTLDKKSLIYQWKLNGDILGDKSGVGKDSLHINKIYGFPRETRVEVNVRSLDGSMSANKVMVLNPGISEIDFYVDEKTMPFSFKSVAHPKLTTNFLDSDIVAIPYFFNDINISDIKWVVNNNQINLLSGGDDLRINIVRNKENINSPLKIHVSIENQDRIFQSADTKVTFQSSESLVEQYKEIERQEREKQESASGSSFFGL